MTRWKKYSLIILLGLTFVGCSFAQNTETTGLDYTKTSMVVYYIISFLSWARVFLANIAGKLMTNDLVMGGAFHMDKYIWDMWNLTKNIANFGIGFLFIMSIGQYLIGSDSDIKKVVKNIGGFLVTGVLINFSYFVIIVLIDLSTVLTSAAGSLPQTFIDQSPSTQQQLGDLIGEIPNKMTLNFEQQDTNKIITFDTPETTLTESQIYDLLLPQPDNMSGPLIYIGSTILDIQSISFLSTDTFSGKADFKQITLSGIFNLAIVVTFSLAIFLLVIINIIRIGLIWIVSALSPILFLLRGLDRFGILPSGLKKMIDGYKFSTLINIIFIPVRVILGLSCVLIFTHSINTLLNPTSTQPGTDYLTPKQQDLYDNGVSNVGIIDIDVNGALLGGVGDQAKDLVSTLFVTIVTLMLMWVLVKLSLPSKDTPFIGEAISGATGIIEAGAASIPIPGSNISVGSIRQASKTAYNSKSNLLKNLDKDGKKTHFKTINKIMGNTEQVAFDNDTHGSEITKLMANSNSNNNLTQQLIKIFKKETKEDNIFYKFSNSDFSNHMKDWYKSTPAKTYITNTLKARYTKDLPDDITKRTREQTKIFHRLLTDEQHGMGLTASSTPTDGASLMNIKYSGPKQK